MAEVIHVKRTSGARTRIKLDAGYSGEVTVNVPGLVYADSLVVDGKIAQEKGSAVPPEQTIFLVGQDTFFVHENATALEFDDGTLVDLLDHVAPPVAAAPIPTV
jgi:hypothetical protein